MTMDMTIVIIGGRNAAGKLSKEAYRVKRDFSFACRAKKNGRDSTPVFVGNCFPFLLAPWRFSLAVGRDSWIVDRVLS